MIDPETTGMTVGDRDYPEILKKSGWWATIAAVLFLTVALLCMVSIAIIAQSTIDVSGGPHLMAWGVGFLFFVGVVLLAVATLRGFLQTHQPEDGERAETEALDGENGGRW